MKITDEYYMKIALKEAKKAYNNGDVPIGCVIVYQGSSNKKVQKAIEDANIKENQIVSKSYNKRNKNKTAIAHAEILAINKACKKIKDFRLDDLVMYVTLEPCQMCAGAIVQSRIKKVVIGCKSFKSGSAGTVLNILNNNEFNHIVETQYGIMESECSSLIKNFFKNIRM